MRAITENILAVTIIMVMLFALTACGQQAPPTPEATQPAVEETVTTDKPTEAAPEEKTQTEQVEEPKEEQPKEPAGEPAAKIANVQTIKDAMEIAEEGFYQSANYDDAYVYVFKSEGCYYRVTAPLTQEESQALYAKTEALDFFAPDYNEQLKELMADVKVENIEDLSVNIPSAEEINQWVGKTGADMLNAGWTTSGSFDLSSSMVYMLNDIYEYEVIFDGNYEGDEVPDDFDIAAYITPLTVKSIQFSGLGDATNIES